MKEKIIIFITYLKEQVIMICERNCAKNIINFSMKRCFVGSCEI